MTFIELFIIAIGVSMDAFAVSICKGLSVSKLKPKHMLSAGLWFGGFQALMPLIGFYVGIHFSDLVTGVDHWIAFALLADTPCFLAMVSIQSDSSAVRKIDITSSRSLKA